MEGKRVSFAKVEKKISSETKAKIDIIRKCFIKIYHDLPLGCLEEEPDLDEDSFSSKKWNITPRKNKTKDQIKSPLALSIPQLIQNICQTALDTPDNYAVKLMFYEFLQWLKSTLEEIFEEKDTLTKIKLRAAYITAILQTNLISHEKDEKTRQQLEIIKRALQKTIPDSSLIQLKIQLINLVKNGKATLETSLHFLHALLSNTEPTTIPELSTLDPKDDFFTQCSNKKSGRLLSTLLLESPLKEIYKEKEQLQKPSPRALLSTGLHRKSSIKQIRISNPFIACVNDVYSLRIPITVLNHYQYNLNTLPLQYFNCQNGMMPTDLGIYSPFLNEPTINFFIYTHALLYELSRVLLSCKEALDLMEEDYDLLEYLQINACFTEIMKIFNDLLTDLQSNMNYLVSTAEKTFSACATNKSMKDPYNATWMKNFGTISIRKKEFDAVLSASCTSANSICEIAKRIPMESRQNTVIQKLMQFEQAVSLQNKEINAILTKLKKPVIQSPQTSPRTNAPESPTITRNSGPAEPPKKNTNGRRRTRQLNINDSLETRRRDGKSNIITVPFEIPEPKVVETSDEISKNTAGEKLSPAPVATRRPSPPSSPPSLPKSESSSPISRLGLGSPVMPRKRNSDQSPPEETQGFLATHSPQPDKDANEHEPSLVTTVEAPSTVTAHPLQLEQPKIAHCISLFGIKKAKPEKPARCLQDKDMSEVLALIRPDTDTIELQKNEISGIGVVPLCKALEAHNSIQQLNLSSNPLLFSEIDASQSPNFCPYPAAKALEELLEKNKSLKKFWVSECCFTSVTCIGFFANGLRNNVSLEFFDIGENNITDDGAILLFKALFRHPTLFALAIDGNQLTDTGAKALLELVQKNTKITFIRFDRNNISDKFSGEIQAQVNANLGARESATIKTVSK